MKILTQIVLGVLSAIILSSCASQYKIHEKYAGVVGKQYLTKSDGYIWKMSRNEREIVPFKLWSARSSGLPGTRIEFIPAGSVITVTSAIRSNSGGAWDYLIAQVRGPETGVVYTFEEMLGFSTFFPPDLERRWEPVEKSANLSSTSESNLIPEGMEVYHAPNATFSIRKDSFSARAESHTVKDSGRSGSLSFQLPDETIYRIDYWPTREDPLERWTRGSTESNGQDRVIEGMLKFTESKTRGLRDLDVIMKRSSAEFEEALSYVGFRMRIEGTRFEGTTYRGYLAFSNHEESYVLHYQTADLDNISDIGGEILERLLSFKNGLIFHRH